MISNDKHEDILLVPSGYDQQRVSYKRETKQQNEY